MINILTIDLEDYFMVSAFESVVKRESWDRYESRIERNTYLVLNILAGCQPPSLRRGIDPLNNAFSFLQPTAHDSSDFPTTENPAPKIPVRATFFCLGWIAERYPHLIREIARQKHEIACHSYDHRLVYYIGHEQFREDIRKSKRILEDIIGQEVIGYRAPSYSITKKCLWALEILAEEGYKYDSSIFPIHHDRYGIPTAPRFPFMIDLNHGKDIRFIPLYGLNRANASTLTPHGINLPYPLGLEASSNVGLIEFPISTVKFLGANVPMGGGGYFRLLPYPIVKRGLRRINDEDETPFIFYIHPWEFDSGQPRFNNESSITKIRHYINLDKTRIKIENLLADFSFSSIKEIFYPI